MFVLNEIGVLEAGSMEDLISESDHSPGRFNRTHYSDHTLVFCATGDFTHWYKLIAEWTMIKSEIMIEYIGDYSMVGSVFFPGVLEAEILEADHIYSEYYRGISDDRK